MSKEVKVKNPIYNFNIVEPKYLPVEVFRFRLHSSVIRSSPSKDKSSYRDRHLGTYQLLGIRLCMKRK